MISHNWKKACVRDVLDSAKAGVSVNGEDRPCSQNELGVLKVSAVSTGTFDPSETKCIRVEEVHKAKLNPQKNCILFSRANTPELVGASAYVNQTHSNLYLSDKLWLLSPKCNETVDMRWLALLLSSPFMRHRISKLATGTIGSMKNISKEALMSLEIVLPPLDEQIAIAYILSTWDEAIEKTERLSELKEKYFQSQISSLIFKKGFERRKLRTVISEVSKRNQSGLSRVLSVTNHSGFVLSEEQFKHRVASQNLENYKVIHKGHFAYNPSRLNVGSIAKLDSWEVGVLSPMYVVFEVDEKNIHPDLLYYWLQTNEARYRICASTQGSVRESVNFSDFANLSIPIPKMPTQEEIIYQLNTISQEINILKTIKSCLSKQKRGLMQKLLTGKWRVNIKEEIYHEKIQIQRKIS